MATIFGEFVASPAFKVTRTATGIECDICKRVIPTDHKIRETDRKYYTVTTGHHDWGYDSIDSVETQDICPSCIHNYISEYLKEVYHSRTAYIEIESEFAWAEKETKIEDRCPKDGEIVKRDHADW